METGRVVGPTGFEPATSCLSSKRSKPTELRSRLCCKYINIFKAHENHMVDSFGHTSAG